MSASRILGAIMSAVDRFAYRPYRDLPSPADDSGLIFKPELKVLVRGTANHARELDLWGLVDPGATECILPYEVAEEVKATFKGKGSMADYAGTAHAVEYGSVILRIKLKEVQIKWTAVVAFDRDRKQSALWGRVGFLDHFRVTFDGPGKHFTIRLVGSAPHGFTMSPVPKRGRRSTKRGSVITPPDQNP
jgi:hypothetical protein